MRCAACGYDQPENFGVFETTMPTIDPHICKLVRYEEVYVCPCCGTLKTHPSNGKEK